MKEIHFTNNIIKLADFSIFIELLHNTHGFDHSDKLGIRTFIKYHHENYIILFIFFTPLNPTFI